MTDDTNIGSIDFTPDAPGTYVVRVWHDQNADGFYNAGTEKTRTITVVAGGIPASMTIATYGATSTVDAAGIVDANEDGSFKSIDELKALYEGAGVDLKKDTIAYCRIGERSAHSWFVLHELLGVKNVSNYDGSWTEYGSLVGVPVAVGDEPGSA